MMGFQTAPAQLFDDFCLDNPVPADHLLRRVDRFLDLESVRSTLKPFYSSMGRFRCINLGGLEESGHSRSRSVVSV
jgi:hypothetical protein